jgi:NADPH-dependent 2,4-dienoyl-CoA reductase/sulfur reductase-like enzyme
MAKERLVITGGNGAGMSAAANARRRRDDLEIIALERGPHVSFAG